MTVYIYGLYDPRNGNLRYIGKTLNLNVRMALHMCETRNSHKNQWLKQLKSLGLKPEIRTLETIENSNDQDWQERERWWISSSRELGHPLTNLDAGGRGGNLKCEETRIKISLANTGKKKSPETCLKISAAKKNPSEETIKRLRAASMGRKHSEETKAKRIAKLIGRPVSEETRRKISESNKIAKARYFELHPPKCRQPKIPKPRPKHTEESKLKMSIARRGKKQTPEHIENAHAKLRGRTRSEETKRKMSEGKRLGWVKKKAMLAEQTKSLSPVF